MTYTKTAMSLHWLMAILLFGLLALGFYMHDLPLSPQKLQFYSWHKWAGVTAFLLVLAFTPAAAGWWLIAFLLFRLFDILKPWPISVADRSIKGGFGVMFDDLLAAGYAIAAIQLLRPLLQSLI